MNGKDKKDEGNSFAAHFEAIVQRSRAISFRAADGRPAFDPPSEVARLSLTLTAVAGTAGYAGADVLNSDVLYSGGYCDECPTPRGQRTQVPLAISFNSPRDVRRDALRVRIDERIFLTLLLYSEDFLGVLSADERSRFEWRRVDVVGREQGRRGRWYVGYAPKRFVPNVPSSPPGPLEAIKDIKNYGLPTDAAGSDSSAIG